MAVLRQFNWLGSARVDVPHLRLVESAVAGDLQALSGTLMTGSRALVAWGAIVLDTGTVGSPASSLLMRMASAVLMHATAAEPGAIFTVSTTQPDDVLNGTNSNVVGSFTPGVHQVNYVSLDLIRLADPTTEDAVVFRSSATGAEFTQVVPLGRVLQYRIHITTADFGSNPSYCPIAKVTLDANGNIESVQDARQMFWRLGSGGTTPNTLAQYVWSNRNESTSVSGFTGGDKDLRSQSDFNRATMQRLWELGGGEHWYSPADDRTVQLTYDNTLIFPATGENWDSVSSPGDLLWRGLSFWFANSTATENVVADATIATPGLTDLADGELIYVELNRTANVTINPIKASWATLFTLPPATPGSRFVLAWRQHGRVYVGSQNLVVNIGGAHATNTVYGTVRLFTLFIPDTSNPVVPVMDALPASILANPATPANVVARGITRDSAGTLLIGPNTNTFDTAVDISAAGILTRVLGTLTVSQLATFSSNITASATINNTGASINVGNGSTTGLNLGASLIQRYNTTGDWKFLSRLAGASADTDFQFSSYNSRSSGRVFAVAENYAGVANDLFWIDHAGKTHAAGLTVAGDTTTTLTTKSYVDGTQSIATNGYRTLPGGLIEQWGTAVLPDGDQDSIALPIPFPTECFYASVVPDTTSDRRTTVNLVAGPTAVITKVMQFNSAGAFVGGTVRFYAIGH